MNQSRHLPIARIGLAAMLAACLVLPACGRRGPPEAPLAPATTEAPAATVA
jgi:predicted small lipoprotein YifL